jgi:hypothetical protein
MRRNRRHDCVMNSSRICPRPPHPPRPSRAAPCRRACRCARPSGCASMRCMRMSSAHVHAADTSSPQLNARSSLGNDHRTLCRYITEASMPGREQHGGSIVGPKSRSVDPAAVSCKARPTPCATQPAARRAAQQAHFARRPGAQPSRLSAVPAPAAHDVGHPGSHWPGKLSRGRISHGIEIKHTEF